VGEEMKAILALIYIRTLLAIVEDRFTPTMKKINAKCEELERGLYRKNKKLYAQCQEIAKETWIQTKEGKDGYMIHVEPVVCSLYYSVEQEMKKLKFKPTLFNRLYDKYFHTSDCELENKSVKLADFIWDTTNKVMMGRVAV
jgi:hypothetical protein